MSSHKQNLTYSSCFFELSLDMLGIADSDGYFKLVNPIFLKNLGYTEKELTKYPYLNFVHPLDLESTKSAIQQLSKDQPIVNFENRYRCQDGSYKMLHWTFNEIPDEQLIYTIARDVTKQKQSQEALQKSDYYLQSIFRAAPGGIGLIQDRVFKHVNENICQLTGYKREELIDQNARLLYSSDEEYKIVGQEKYRQIQEKGTGTVETRFQRKDGNIIDVLLSSTPLDMNDFSKGVTFTVTDISAIKQSKLALQKSQNKYLDLYENAPDMYLSVDPKTINVIQCNQTLLNILGFKKEEIVGHPVFNLYTAESARYVEKNIVPMFLDKGIVRNEYLQVKTKNGDIIDVSLNITAIRDEQGNILHSRAIWRDITLMKKHQYQLEHIAHYDLLTNLPNRVLLADRLSQAMLQCRRHKQSLAVAFLDLDGFKLVNDTHGHDVGDELLIALSLRMKEALRENDTLSRIGGDEFVAVLTDLTKIEDCEPVLERLLLAASEPITIGEIVLNISASIGVTLYPQDNMDADLLMRHADQAMYVAKESGKNRYHLFDVIQDDAVKVQRESIEAIRSALDNHQFLLYYQPKVNMRTGTVEGVEALIRWQHPERGLLNPIDFLPVIENNPMSIEMGEWVIDTALTQISQWQTMELNIPVSTSVNISAVQLQQPDFTDRLTILLAEHPDVEPCYLELEVLETSALDDVHYASSTMNACKALGVSFALDDFGTGYSSLTYLRRLPASMIKIDQTFVRDMLIDADDLAIVEGVIALAKSFKRDVIAEGVETIEHGTALLQLGCELAQGYGIARPMPADDIPAWIRDWKPDVSWQS
ncbi:MAG: EAL domain-containing protein [Colwellia sp.]|nr:EAL domain-containing protein [Colwellia sp.]